MNFAEFLPLFPWIVFGVALGTFVGAIPGLTGAMVIALAVPLTFSMNENAALALLVSIYTGSVSGGLISATLLKIPGTPAAMITILDAYPMTERGESGRALSLGIGASFVGGILSGLVLFFLARPMAEWSVKLSPFDLFSLTAMSMVFIVAVSDRGRLGLGKGLLSGMAGCLFALPGMHPATGEIRYTFGLADLNDGLNLLPVLIGVFALAQAFRDLKTGSRNGSARSKSETHHFSRVRIREWFSHRGNLLRSSAIGTLIGILPGIGANIGSTVAYGIARHFSKEPDRFGKGSEEGILASESANNATVGGALIPLVALGIPGSVIDAILIGALIVHGIQPGPLLFQNHPEAVHSLIAAYLVSNLVMLVLMVLATRWIVSLGRISAAEIAPLIILCCVVGSYSLGNRMFDVWVMAAFGFVGLLMQRWRIPAAPFVIGFVLTPIAEQNLGAGLMISGGSYLALLVSPFSLVCILGSAAILFLPLLRSARGKRIRKAD